MVPRQPTRDQYFTARTHRPLPRRPLPPAGSRQREPFNVAPSFPLLGRPTPGKAPTKLVVDRGTLAPRAFGEQAARFYAGAPDRAGLHLFERFKLPLERAGPGRDAPAAAAHDGAAVPLADLLPVFFGVCRLNAEENVRRLLRSEGGGGDAPPAFGPDALLWVLTVPNTWGPAAMVSDPFRVPPPGK